MSGLVQRSEAWFAARKNKLTASNLGAALGQISWTSRVEALRRARGLSEFKGNEATEWGTNMESVAVSVYEELTGNVVTETGLHSHAEHTWLGGSPDGLVGADGLVEVKCPYYRKVVHKSVPVYYWMQCNAVMEITGREFCGYVCSTPEEVAIYRINRDRATFNTLLPYYKAFADVIPTDAQEPPPLKEKRWIRELLDTAVRNSVDTTYWTRLSRRDAHPSDLFADI